VSHSAFSLSTVDDAPLRRIHLSYSDAPYRDLKERAIRHHLGRDNDNASLPAPAFQGFSVRFTYKDTDGDTCLIASNEELIDALRQYKKAGSVRILAEVKPLEDVSHVYASSPCEGFRARESVESSTQTNDDDAAENRGRANSQPQVQLAHVVEGLVAILASAVIALQGQISAFSNNVQVASAEASARAATARHTAEQAGASARTNQDAPAAEATSSPEEDAPERPFIHGRHTCDGCLTTPIIGERYHATNMPDYDFCKKCFDNYSGTSITFEPVELGTCLSFAAPLEC